VKLPDWVTITDANRQWLHGDKYQMAVERIPNLHLNMAEKPWIVLCMKPEHTGGRQYETLGRAAYWAARPDTWCEQCRIDVERGESEARLRVLKDLTNRPKPVVVEPIPVVPRRRKRKG
jgi:hypothetical protein